MGTEAGESAEHPALGETAPAVAAGAPTEAGTAAAVATAPEAALNQKEDHKDGPPEAEAAAADTRDPSSAPEGDTQPSLKEQSQEPQGAAPAASPPHGPSSGAVPAGVAAPPAGVPPGQESKPEPAQEAAPLQPGPAVEAPGAQPQQQAAAEVEEEDEEEEARLPEEKHHQKPQWRRALQGGATAHLTVTVTPSDCNTRRLRPPRPWYDSLLGGSFASFEMRAAGPGGPISFFPQAHAYPYAKAEYYVQGSETKRMFTVLGVQPGDALTLRPAGRGPGGVPVVDLRLTPAAENPHSADILNAVASSLAKRAAPAPSPSKAAGGAARKRKGAPVRAADGEALPGGAAAAGEEDSEPEGGAARKRRFPYGSDFVVGAQQTAYWKAGGAGAGAGSGDEDDPAWADDGRAVAVVHAPAVPAPPPPVLRMAPVPGAPPPGVAVELPTVVATGLGGRNVLRIKMPPRGAAGATSPRAPDSATAGGLTGRRGSDHLAMLAGVADDMQTPTCAPPLQQRPPAAGAQAGPPAAAPAPGAAPPAAAQPAAPALPAAAPAGDSVLLLSRTLTRDDAGNLTGARCALSWEPEKVTAAQVSKQIRSFSVEYHDVAEIEEYALEPKDHGITLSLRLAAPSAGAAPVEDALSNLLRMLCAPPAL